MDFEKRLKEMSELRSSAPLLSMDDISAKLDELPKDIQSNTNWRVIMATGTGISILAVLSYLLFFTNDTESKKTSAVIPMQENKPATEQIVEKSDNLVPIKPKKVSSSITKKAAISRKESAHASNAKKEMSEFISFGGADTNSVKQEVFDFISISRNDTSTFKENEEVKKSEEEWKAAVEGRVLSLPTISPQEAQALGIYFEGKYMSYVLEYYDRFYPISYKKNPRYKEDSKVKSFVNSGYPLDNSQFLYKKLYVANLGKELDEIQKTVNKYDAMSDQDIKLGKRNMIIPAGKKLRRSIYCDTILKYDGTAPNQYSHLTPVFVFMQSKGEFNNFRFSMMYDRTALMQNTDNSDLKNLNDYIPVKIELPDEYSPSIKSIVLWFMPSEKLFSSLPKEIGSELQRQYNIFKMVEDGKLSKSEACGEVSDKDYLGLCGLSNKDFSVKKIYPNPVKENFTIDIDVVKKGAYEIELFDQSGNKKDYKKVHIFAKGNFSVPMEMDDLPTGLYFLRISNSEDNYITSRIIKE